MKWNEVGARLFQLEDDCGDELLSFRLGRWPVWQSVKSYLYFDTTNQSKAGGLTADPVRRQQQFRLLSEGPRDLMRWARCLNGSQPRPWAYTQSVDKRNLGSTSGYQNYLCDAFASQALGAPWVYAEVPYQGRYPGPAELPTNLPLGPLLVVRRMVRSVCSYRPAVKRLARELSAYLTRAFTLRRIPISTRADRLAWAISGFFAELLLHRRLFQLYPPSLIVTSEQVGTGMLAAARECRIPVLDLQHGLIDTFHPYYQYSGGLRRYKSQMIVPDLLGVFGEAHRDSLLQPGFWSPEDIAVVGSRQISEARRVDCPQPTHRQVFFPTQWVLPQETRRLVRHLLQDATREGFLLTLKPHPLEALQVVQEYRSLAESHKGHLRLADQNEDLAGLIRSSHLTIGFDSTVLLEAVALGRPVVSVGTDSMPRGIHDLLEVPGLEEAIQTVPLVDTEQLSGLLRQAFLDESLYRDWCASAHRAGQRLFAFDYESRVKATLHSLGLRAQDG